MLEGKAEGSGQKAKGKVKDEGTGAPRLALAGGAGVALEVILIG